MSEEGLLNDYFTHIFSGKEGVPIIPHLKESLHSSSFRACHHNTENPAAEACYATKTEDAVLPGGLKRITADILFPW
jgi:hypothetical protein